MKSAIAVFLLLVPIFMPFAAHAADSLELYFFFNPTCPHCIAEEKFLDGLEERYPDLVVRRIEAYGEEGRKMIAEMAPRYDAERYVGLVPLTFVGGDFFLGFDDDEGIGAKIEASVRRQLPGGVPDDVEKDGTRSVKLPVIGTVDLGAHSLPVIAATLGFFDGFNVCSLGALVMILGLVLVLKSRKKIAFFGGLFLLTTAVVYGGLIFLWYGLFEVLAPYVRAVEFVVGAIGIAGAVIFFREFLKFKRYGPTCDSSKGGVASKLFTRIQKIFENPGSAWLLVGSVLLFAAAVAVVEFPCSASIPVLFAGMLSAEGFSFASSLPLVALFLFFYLLDEIIIYAIAVSKMDIWLSSPRFVIWITLIEAVILALLGAYYLATAFGFAIW